MITKTTVVRGSIVGNDDLTIEGQVEGSVRIDGALTVGNEASRRTCPQPRDTGGQIEGSVESESSFVVSADAVVISISIKTIRCGRLKGRIEMDLKFKYKHQRRVLFFNPLSEEIEHGKHYNRKQFRNRR